MRLLLSVSAYTGSAHPSLEYKTFTFALDQQRELMVADTFHVDYYIWKSKRQ